MGTHRKNTAKNRYLNRKNTLSLSLSISTIQNVAPETTFWVTSQTTYNFFIPNAFNHFAQTFQNFLCSLFEIVGP